MFTSAFEFARPLPGARFGGIARLARGGGALAIVKAAEASPVRGNPGAIYAGEAKSWLAQAVAAE